MVRDDHIKFYSVHDLAASSHLKRIPIILDNGICQINKNDINQIIELYNIKKYIDSGLYLPDWDNQQIERYRYICKSIITPQIGRFFSDIGDENLIPIHDSIQRKYHADFWDLFAKYNLHSRISSRVFSDLLESRNLQIKHILEYKKIVNAYGSAIALYLSNHPGYATLIMQEHLEKQDQKNKLHFPCELSPDDKAKVVSDYIVMPDANPSYINLVAISSSSKELPIDDHIKLKAQHLYKQWVKDHIDFNSGIKYGVSVRFIDSDEAVDYSVNDLTVEFTYGTKWIKENMDYPTLLNNLIHLFCLVDDRFRCVLVSLPNHMSMLERLVGVKGKNEYMTGSEFNLSDMISNAQILCYQNFLKTQGIQLESLYKWFFEKYLQDEFDASGFVYDAPSNTSSILEKCRTLATAMDSTLKQYRMFCQDGVINRELFEISSEHIFFNRVPSLQPCKYIYAKSNEIKEEMNLCYSDQTLLTYIPKINKHYDNLPHMLLQDELTINDFEHFQRPQIDFLIQRGVIDQTNPSRLGININRAYLLKELYNNEVICYSYCIPEIKSLIDQLVALGDLEIDNTLFSKPEQDYLNYMLNRSDFSNGMDIRNKYLHGTNSQNKGVIEHDYIELLKLTAIEIIKVNEEFCLRFPQEFSEYSTPG